MVYAIDVLLLLLWVVAVVAHDKALKRLNKRVAAQEQDGLRIAQTLVKTAKELRDEIAKVDERRAANFESNHRALNNCGDFDKELDAKIEGLDQRIITLEGKQPAANPKPKKVSFRQFRDAVERASEPTEEPQ